MGDFLVAYGVVPTADGNRQPMRAARVDMSTGRTTFFGDGPGEMGEASGAPSIIGEKVFVPAFLNVGNGGYGYRVFDLASGAFLRDSLDIYSGDLNRTVVEMSGRIIGTRFNYGNNQAELAAFNSETLAYEETVVANVFSLTSLVSAGAGAAAPCHRRGAIAHCAVPASSLPHPPCRA